MYFLHIYLWMDTHSWTGGKMRTTRPLILSLGMRGTRDIFTPQKPLLVSTSMDTPKNSLSIEQSPWNKPPQNPSEGSKFAI